MDANTRRSRHLWQDKKPVEKILESGDIGEVKVALEQENKRLKALVSWMSGAYSTSEMIQILQACQFDENEIVLYGFSKTDILDAIETGNEAEIPED